MSYVVFDLDQTVADLLMVFPFLYSLRIKEHMLENHPHLFPFFPPDLEDTLQQAYQRFVGLLLQEERSATPLGILRPGFLSVATRLQEMKQRGEIRGVVLYSNNRHLPSLHLVRDMIELFLDAPLFSDCIHWMHPMREPDYINPYVSKTWEVLSRILIEGPTQAPRTLLPRQVHFFDDLHHVDLERTLAEQYYQVPPYHVTPSLERLIAHYVTSIQECNLNLHPFILYLMNTFELTEMMPPSPDESTIECLLDVIRQFSSRVCLSGQSTSAAMIDRGIQLMHSALEDIHQHHRIKRRSRHYTQRTRRYTVKRREKGHVSR